MFRQSAERNRKLDTGSPNLRLQYFPEFNPFDILFQECHQRKELQIDGFQLKLTMELLLRQPCSSFPLLSEVTISRNDHQRLNPVIELILCQATGDTGPASKVERDWWDKELKH